MNTKATLPSAKSDFKMLNQPNNFEDALSSRDDLQCFLHPSGQSLTKVSSWHSFHSFLSSDPSHNQTVSANASPSVTPQGSPATYRKQLVDPSKHGNVSEMKKRWFNSHLFPTFSESNSCKNVSNFDINAVGPISF